VDNFYAFTRFETTRGVFAFWDQLAVNFDGDSAFNLKQRNKRRYRAFVSNHLLHTIHDYFHYRLQLHNQALAGNRAEQLSPTITDDFQTVLMHFGHLSIVMRRVVVK